VPSDYFRHVLLALLGRQELVKNPQSTVKRLRFRAVTPPHTLAASRLAARATTGFCVFPFSAATLEFTYFL
jgi:hypothetical protein